MMYDLILLVASLLGFGEMSGHSVVDGAPVAGTTMEMGGFPEIGG